jgi:hypothetical protein
MSLSSAVTNAAAGDNVIGHVVTAGALGGAISGVTVWGLQCAQLNPPASIDQSITVICMVIASWILQKLA